MLLMSSSHKKEWLPMAVLIGIAAALMILFFAVIATAVIAAFPT